MRIGGMQKFSLIDYPGKVACVIFTQGCNFRCGYCHNPELVIPERYCSTIAQEQVFEFVKSRRNYLQGVVVTGGEPTLQSDLIAFLARIKELGHLIKIDTNGSQPKRLKELIDDKLVDYVAMDIKTVLSCYEELAAMPVNIAKIKESIDLIIHSGIDHEFRTTVVKPFCSLENLYAIRQYLKGAKRYRLQELRLTQKILNKELLAKDQFTGYELDQIKHVFELQVS